MSMSSMAHLPCPGVGSDVDDGEELRLIVRRRGGVVNEQAKGGATSGGRPRVLYSASIDARLCAGAVRTSQSVMTRSTASVAISIRLAMPRPARSEEHTSELQSPC